MLLQKTVKIKAVRAHTSCNTAKRIHGENSFNYHFPPMSAKPFTYTFRVSEMARDSPDFHILVFNLRSAKQMKTSISSSNYEIAKQASHGSQNSYGE